MEIIEELQVRHKKGKVIRDALLIEGKNGGENLVLLAKDPIRKWPDKFYKRLKND